MAFPARARTAVTSTNSQGTRPLQTARGRWVEKGVSIFVFIRWKELELFDAKTGLAATLVQCVLLCWSGNPPPARCLLRDFPICDNANQTGACLKCLEPDRSPRRFTLELQDTRYLRFAN